MSNDVVSFIEFSKSEYDLADPQHDVLGFAVYDKDGEHIGYVEELLLDNSAPASAEQPASRRVSLAVVNIGGVLGHDQVVVPFEVFGQVDEERREVRVQYTKAHFEHEELGFHGVNFLDQDRTGHIYGLYNMNDSWFNQRSGADPDMVKG